jgi:general L-amino acid transport system substrate-binding protein
VIKAVGNYGESLNATSARTPLGIARGVNALWSKGGLMYAPPIR